MSAPMLYHYSENGIYLFPSPANPSPLEEGVWLYPARSTEIAPPVIPDGKCAVWNGSGWDIQDMPELTESKYTPEEKDEFIEGLMEGLGV